MTFDEIKENKLLDNLSCIYLIRHKNSNAVYVGSTDKFRYRMECHKRRLVNESDKRHYNIKLYKFIRDNGGMDNFTVDVLEDIPMGISREEREKIEQTYIYFYRNEFLHKERYNVLNSQQQRGNCKHRSKRCTQLCFNPWLKRQVTYHAMEEFIGSRGWADKYNPKDYIILTDENDSSKIFEMF